MARSHRLVDVADMSLEERVARFARPLVPAGPGCDPEVLVREVLEEPTALELAGGDRLDAVDLEIFLHKLDSIIDDGRDVCKYLSMAEALQAGDLGVGIFTSKGDLAGMSTGVVLHALLHYGPVKYVLKHYVDDPTVGLEDGDVFFFNDPDGGGVHTYDHFLMMPVFFKDELLAWVACGGHQGETGSRSPGGWSPQIRSRYEEGLHVSPLRIGRRCQLQTDHLDFILNSVRTPRQNALDIKARLAVCVRLREQLLREVERRGPEFVAAGLRRSIQVSAELARERIRTFNDGVYRATVFLDTIGIDDSLIRIPVALHKRDDRLIIDLAGASPEPGIGPFHLRWHLARAASAAALFPTVFRGLRWSIGLFDPVTLTCPPSILNAPSRDAGTGSGSHTGRVVVQGLLLAAMRMLHDSPFREGVTAPFAENLLLIQFGGTGQYGNPIAGGPTNGNATGQGARFDLDGEHSAGFFWAMVVDCPGPEEQERKFPFLYLFRNRFDRDVAGMGKYRGGVGLTDCFVIHGTPELSFNSVGTGGRFTKNYGVFGGYSGAAQPRILIRASNVNELMAAGAADLPMSVRELVDERVISGEYIFDSPNSEGETCHDGDVFVLARGSGGGYGDVLEREPDAVLGDLRDGIVSEALARDVYGVVLDAGRQLVDRDATDHRRAELRAERRRRGRPYAEFMRDWSLRRPPEEALRHYGDFPVPRQVVDVDAGPPPGTTLLGGDGA
jgi:N-methylhydantoinase B/oxoprolinase/acetone carboxylase alpha subunit